MGCLWQVRYEVGWHLIIMWLAALWTLMGCLWQVRTVISCQGGLLLPVQCVRLGLGGLQVSRLL